MSKKQSKTLDNPVFVWVTDMHINSKQALSLPEISKGDGEFYYASDTQLALYEAWKDAWKQVKAKADGRPIVVGIGGEIVDIDFKKRSDQYISRDEESVRDHAMIIFTPVVDLASKIIVLRGTEAHTGLNSKQDEKMAAMFEKYKPRVVHKNTETGEFSWYYLRINIGGKKFDLAHHVSMGNAVRTERDAANHIASDLIMDYTRWGEPIPHFAFRGHVHRVSDSSVNYPIRAYIGACWSVATSYVHRLGKGASKPEIGLLFCDPNKNEVEYISYDYKREAPESL